MIRSLEFNGEEPNDSGCIAAMRLAILTTALACHDTEGLRRMRADFAEGLTSRPMASRLRVEIGNSEAFTIWEQPLSGRVSPPRQRAGFIRLEFTPAEVTTALGMIPPYRFGRI